MLEFYERKYNKNNNNNNSANTNKYNGNALPKRKI